MATQQRRKTTREQARKKNIQKMQTQSKRAGGKERMNWNTLIKLFDDCQQMYTPLHAITLALASKGFRERASEDSCKNIMDQVKQLTGHVNATLDDLHSIRAKHFGRTGEVRGEKRTLEAIQIGMDYQNWVAKFNESVLILALDISGMIEEIIGEQVFPRPVQEQPVAPETPAEPLFEEYEVQPEAEALVPETPTEATDNGTASE